MTPHYLLSIYDWTKGVLSVLVIVAWNRTGELSSNSGNGVCISLCANVFWKDMNPYVPPPITGKLGYLVLIRQLI